MKKNQIKRSQDASEIISALKSIHFLSLQKIFIKGSVYVSFVLSVKSCGNYFRMVEELFNKILISNYLFQQQHRENSIQSFFRSSSVSWNSPTISSDSI